MLKSILAGAALALALVAPAAAVQTPSSDLVIVTDAGAGVYTFTQGGFAGGGSITGSFTGFDLNSDNQINSFDDEVSAFVASFSGNGKVPAINFIDGLLVYDLDGSGLLGDGFDGTEFEGIVGFSPDFNGSVYVAGPGPYFGIACGNGETCAVVQAAVPEPASWALLIAGFGLTGATLRRRLAAFA